MKNEDLNCFKRYYNCKMQNYLEVDSYLSIWGRREYQGARSSRRLKWSSKVVTVWESHLTFPIFRLLVRSVEGEELLLFVVVTLLLLWDGFVLLVWEAEVPEWPLSKLRRMRQPRSPQGSVSAIRRISRATRVKRSGGRRTSDVWRWAFLAARRAPSKRRATARTVAAISADSKSTSTPKLAPFWLQYPSGK